MLENLPDAIGHALRNTRAGLDHIVFNGLDLRAGMASIAVTSLAFVDHGPLPAAYCRLIKGNTYYMNIRFQDGRPASIGGSPTTDSCITGNCGGIIQVL